MKQTVFSGAGVALITPMTKDNKVNYKKLEELIEFQIRNQSDAIIVSGTTGESSTLTEEEYKELIEVAVKSANHRIPVLAGAGSNSTVHAVELSKIAEKAGADALLHVTPYYNKASQNGLIKHYTACAKAVDLPIILYNVPSRTGVNIKPETCERLCKVQNIVGIKEASGNFSQIAKIAALCGDDLNIYSGNDDHIIPILSLGGKGVISVLSNILPKETHEICSGFQDIIEEKRVHSILLQQYYIELIEALFSDINPIPIKQAMNYMGMDVGECRLPLCEMESAASEKLKIVLEKYKLV